MDRFAIEAFLCSTDIDEDLYLMNSSSDDSEEECYCASLQTNEQTKGFAELSVPIFEDHEFREHFRVDRKTFDKILEITRHDFTSNDKSKSNKISPEKAIYILLWYLGNKETLFQISERFKVSIDKIDEIIKKGTLKLASQKEKYILWPSEKEYPVISEMFEDLCQLSGIVGTIGVLNFKIMRPKSPAVSVNYNGLALQGVVTINKKFINIFISEENSDPHDILYESLLSEEANNGLLDDYCLVGHGNYFNSPWMVQSFHDNGKLNNNQKLFNKCHRAASNLILDTFGVLKGRFQRLQNLKIKDMQFVKQYIEATCVIHNICIDCGDDESGFSYQDLSIHEDNSFEHSALGDDFKQREIYDTFLAGIDHKR